MTAGQLWLAVGLIAAGIGWGWYLAERLTDRALERRAAERFRRQRLNGERR